MEKTYYIYILASSRNGTLYIGVTNNLKRRDWEHKHKIHEKSFTKKYAIHKLVYYEETSDVHVALAREKAMKKWNREWKLKLIETMNPEWRDLSLDL